MKKIKLKNAKIQNGQMLIIILLVMIVGLTVGLFLVSRTTTDISSTTKTTDSARSFNAAEAGIEQALLPQASIYPGSIVPVASGSNYTLTKTSVTPAVGNVFPTQKQNQVNLNEVFTVWLIPHQSGGALLEDGSGTIYNSNNIIICFTDNTPHPAIGATFYYKSALGGYLTSYSAYDPQIGTRVSNSSVNFNAAGVAGSTCSGAGYAYQADINFSSHFGIDLATMSYPSYPIALRIRPLYAPTSIAVIAASALPSQGDEIQSTGTSGETTRKIHVTDSYRVPVPFLDSTIYSFTNLCQGTCN